MALTILALRKFHGYDSSVLVAEAADTLIAPGENGILYTMKLNTKFNRETGELSIDPSETVKLRYKTYRSSEQNYWLGMEDSGVMWDNYLYIADNGGNLMCIDINTMKIIWAQDVVDDTNGSPVFSVGGRRSLSLYCYLAALDGKPQAEAWRCTDILRSMQLRANMYGSIPTCAIRSRVSQAACRQRA